MNYYPMFIYTFNIEGKLIIDFAYMSSLTSLFQITSSRNVGSEICSSVFNNKFRRR